jgi:carbamoyl-phosphate synthase large subunit
MGYVGLIKAFQEEGCKVFGVDCDNNAVGFNFCDASGTLPHGDSESYISELLKLCQKHNIQLIVPSSDNEILKVGEDRSMFEGLGVSVLLPSDDSLRICNNKSHFYECLSKWGILHPKVRDILDAEFPAILKPKVGKGSAGVRVVTKIDQLLDMDQEHILQDFIDGDEYTVDVLADKSSTILSMVQRKRVRIESGISVEAEVVEDDEGRVICAQLNERLQMRGVYCIQYIKNSSGIYVLEINPRFGGGSVLSLKANPTIILNYLNIAQNKPVERLCEPKKIKMRRYYAEVFE